MLLLKRLYSAAQLISQRHCSCPFFSSANHVSVPLPLLHGKPACHSLVWHICALTEIIYAFFFGTSKMLISFSFFPFFFHLMLMKQIKDLHVAPREEDIGFYAGFLGTYAFAVTHTVTLNPTQVPMADRNP